MLLFFKRAMRAIRSRHSLQKERNEWFALLKRAQELFVKKKISDLHENPKIAIRNHEKNYL